MPKGGFVLHRCYGWLETWGFGTCCLEIKSHKTMLLRFSPGIVTSDLASILETCTELQRECFTDELPLLFQIVKNILSLLLCQAPLAGEGARQKRVSFEWPFTSPLDFCWGPCSGICPKKKLGVHNSRIGERCLPSMWFLSTHYCAC